MTELYQRLQTALGAICATSAIFDLNPDSGDEYITFTASVLPGNGGDDADTGIAGVSVYYCCPLEYDPLTKRSRILTALDGIADTLIRETEQSSQAGQCYVYSFSVCL